MKMSRSASYKLSFYQRQFIARMTVPGAYWDARFWNPPTFREAAEHRRGLSVGASRGRPGG